MVKKHSGERHRNAKQEIRRFLLDGPKHFEEIKEHLNDNTKWGTTSHSLGLMLVKMKGVVQCGTSFVRYMEPQSTGYMTRWKITEEGREMVKDIRVPSQRELIFIQHEDNKITLKELSKIIGIRYNTLLMRYRKGDRGEALTRPLRRVLDAN
jgi:hypothetical protein